MISDSARLNLWVALAAFSAIGVLIFGVVASPQKEIASAEVSAYCHLLSADLPLTAQAVYAEDVTTGKILFEKNADTQLPLASLTKVMTVLTAIDYLPPDGFMIVSREALAPEGDSGLYENERWRIKDLADFTLMSSANDGAHALVLAAAAEAGKDPDWFVGEMNAHARKIGLTQTFFINDTGLDISSTTAGAYGSARDVAAMMRYASFTKRGVIDGSSDKSRVFVSLSDKKHEVENTSAVSAELDSVIASKTGFTDLAGGNLAVVAEPFPGRPIVAVILGGERESRDSDMVVLLEASKKELKRSILCDQYDY